MTAALAERLAPLQDALAELEAEYYGQARADGEPATWAAWCDLHHALMAIRAAQGRDARAADYRPVAAVVPADEADEREEA